MRGITDSIYTYKFIDLLQKPFSKWNAYKYNIIDVNGNLLRKPETNVEKSSYTKFHALVRKIKQQLTTSMGHTLTKSLAVKTGWDVISEQYDLDLSDIGRELFERDKPTFELFFESLVVGDSSGDVAKIASGVTSGVSVGTVGDLIKKKRKTKK